MTPPPPSALLFLLVACSSLNCSFFFSIIAAAASSSSSAATSPIPLGFKIAVDHPSSRRIALSPKGHFSFGFSRHSDLLPPSQYILGIRFNSPADHSLVWVAGGDVSVGLEGSYFHLTEDGNMLLFDGIRRAVVWSSNTRHLSVVSATLVDDGNLFLSDASGATVWDSFATPSDTLLPGQNLTSSQLLRAASRNSLSSYYSLRIDADSGGQLLLFWESNVSYWSTDAVISSPPVSALTFTDAGALMLLDSHSSVVWSRFADDHHDPSVPFRFLRLDVDGNLRMYSWSESTSSWKVVWQAVQNQCKVFATCGLRGVCFFDRSGSMDCSCPFSSTGTSNPTNSSCLTPYRHECSSSSGSTTMSALPNTFLYGIYPPHDVIVDVGAHGCRSLCMEDPLCTSASVANEGTGQCWLKRTQFVTGYQSPSIASTSFVKECLDPLAVLPPPNTSAASPTQAAAGFLNFWHSYHLLGAALGAILALLLVQVVAGFFYLKRKTGDATPNGMDTLSPNSIGVVSLSYAELQNLTQHFKERIGLNLHRGMLPGDRTMIVVVKDLKDLLAPPEEKQFRSWISVLGSIYHKNLLKLVAYSYSSDGRFVVYPFLKNGSVDKWLKEAKLAKRLTWSKRMEVCLGVARATSYLHSGCRQFICHGNLKWENVLLDEGFEAKLTDYGLAKFSAGASCLAEDDVAKFGEMLIFLVTGISGGSEVCSWAYKEWAACHADKLVDSRMAGKVDVGDLERVLRVAFWCVQDDVRLRPSVSEVTKVLEGSLPVDPPPPPYRLTSVEAST